MRPTDMKILQHIRRNARMNLTTLSRKTGIPISTIFDRLRAQQGGLITRFTALVDFGKLGYPIRAKVFLKVDAQHRAQLRAYLSVHERVNSLWRINNGFDFLAECLFTNIREVEEFLEAVEMKFPILDKHVYHVIEDVVREKVMAEMS